VRWPDKNLFHFCDVDFFIWYGKDWSNLHCPFKRRWELKFEEQTLNEDEGDTMHVMIFHGYFTCK
jgi:hypothetical protein